MDSSIFRISLDVHRQTTQTHLGVRKGDTARKIVASLSDGGRPYRIDEGCYAVFKGKKADGNVLFNNCTITNNCIVYDFTEQTAASAGYMDCQLQLYGPDGKIITSPKFAIIVNGLVYDDGQVESAGEFTALTQAMADVAEMKANGLRGDPGPQGPAGPEGPQGKPLYVSLDVDVKTGGWSSDRTYDEILNKHKAQQEIICILALNDGEDLELRLIQATPAELIFGALVDGVEWQAVISRGSEGEAVVAVSDDSVSTAVRYDCAQELTAEQKAQALKNIGAVNADFVNQCIESNKYKTVMVPVEPVETLEAYILLQNTGALTPLVSGDKSYVVKKYDVAGISTVAITASACMSAYLYSFCSTSGNVIKLSEKAATGTVLTEIVEQVVQVPENATVLYVSHIVTASNIAAVQRVEQRSIDGSDKWAGKKWVCIGDSLTEANQRTTKRYHDYVAEVTGVTVVNMGISGTGYAKGGANTFYGRIANVPADADIVTIFGSGNDLTAGIDLGEVADTGTETLCGCINTTIDNLIARIPTVQLGIVTPTPWVGQQPGAGKPMEAYANAIVEICKARSIPVLDLYHCSNLRPWTEEGRAACYTKDDGNGVHPDETGHKLIAPRFKSFLESLLM